MPSFFPSFFNVPKARAFEYKPLYYDEHKEHLEKLEKKAQDNQTDFSAKKRELRLREELERQRPKRNAKGLLSPKKLLLYLAALMLLLLWLLK